MPEGPSRNCRHVLVARCVAGEEDAWEAFYSAHAPRIAQLVRRLGVPGSAVDDVTQEVFIQAFRSLEQYRGEAAVQTWLYRIAATQARRHRERSRLAGRLWALLASSSRLDADWGEYCPSQAERLLEAGLQVLTPLEREAFVLYELEGQRGAEIATILRCPEATVYRRLHDARKKFQAYIEGDSCP